VTTVLCDFTAHVHPDVVWGLAMLRKTCHGLTSETTHFTAGNKICRLFLYSSSKNRVLVKLKSFIGDKREVLFGEWVLCQTSNHLHEFLFQTSRHLHVASNHLHKFVFRPASWNPLNKTFSNCPAKTRESGTTHLAFDFNTCWKWWRQVNQSQFIDGGTSFAFSNASSVL